MVKQTRWITLALIVLAVGSIAAIVIAAPPPPWERSSADPGTTPQVSQPKVSGDVPDENGFTGSDQATVQDSRSSAAGPLGPAKTETDADRAPAPDKDGYTGPAPDRAQDIIESSANTNTDLPPQPDWSTFHAEPQPDDNVNGASLTAVEPQWSPVFYYVHVAGSALRPRDSSVEWGTSGAGGCVYNVSGGTSIIFNIHADIPDGSLIEYLRIYYYDASASTSYAWVTTYDDGGGFTDVTYVASDGDAGYGTMLSPQVAHVVSMVSDSYALNWRPIASGSNMALCGLRIAYRLPD